MPLGPQLLLAEEPVAVLVHPGERLLQSRHLLAHFEPAQLAVLVDVGSRKAFRRMLGKLHFSLRTHALVIGAHLATHQVTIAVGVQGGEFGHLVQRLARVGVLAPGGHPLGAVSLARVELGAADASVGVRVETCHAAVSAAMIAVMASFPLRTFCSAELAVLVRVQLVELCGEAGMAGRFDAVDRAVIVGVQLGACPVLGLVGCLRGGNGGSRGDGGEQCGRDQGLAMHGPVSWGGGNVPPCRDQRPGHGRVDTGRVPFSEATVATGAIGGAMLAAWTGWRARFRYSGIRCWCCQRPSGARPRPATPAAAGYWPGLPSSVCW